MSKMAFLPSAFSGTHILPSHSYGVADYGYLGAATSGKRKGPITVFKEKHGLAKDKGPMKVVVKRSADGKHCEVQLTFPNPKGGKELVYKEHTKAPFRAALRELCEKTEKGKTRTIEAKGEKLKGLDGTHDFELGYLGASKRAEKRAERAEAGRALSGGKRRKLRYTRTEATAKFRRFRDEDRALDRAYKKKNKKRMARILKRLAGARDRQYRRAYLASEGKKVGQVTGRVVSTVATFGIAAAVRAASKKRVEQNRLRKALKHQEIGDAAAAIYEFWMAKLKGNAKATGNKADLKVLEETEKQLQPGSPISMKAADAVQDFDENAPVAAKEKDADDVADETAAAKEPAAAAVTAEPAAVEETSVATTEAAAEPAAEVAETSGEGGGGNNKMLMYGLGAAALLGLGYFAMRKGRPA